MFVGNRISRKREEGAWAWLSGLVSAEYSRNPLVLKEIVIPWHVVMKWQNEWLLMDIQNEMSTKGKTLGNKCLLL